MESIRLNLNESYDFNFLVKLLNEASIKKEGYKKIKFIPKYSEHNGSISHLSIEIESILTSGDNNFNEY